MILENQRTVADILKAIQQLGSITAAAKHLYVSQPYVSRIINQTEKDLNVQLIDRSAKPLKLTFAGSTYLTGLEKISSQQLLLIQTMEEISQSKTGNISISMSSHLNQPEITNLFANFVQRYPHFHLEVHEAPSVEAEKIVRDNQADLYIGPKSSRQSNFSYRIYRQLGFSIVMPNDYVPTVSKQTTADLLKQLQDHPYIAIDTAMVTGELVAAYQKQLRRTTLPVLTMNNPQLIIQLVNSGTGWSIVPNSYLKDKHLNIQIKPIPINELEYTFIMAHRDSKENTPEMNALLKISQQVYGIDPKTQLKLHD